MPFTVRHLGTLDVVEVMCTGVLTSDELRDSTSEFVAIHRRTGVTRCLVELEDAEVSASLSDIVSLPERRYESESLPRIVRIAVIRPASESARRAAEFYETACQNRGWNARLFSNRQAALDWLTSAAASESAGASSG